MSKILLIEDDPQVIKMYERILELENIDFSFAEDGEEGLNLAIEYHPDVIVLDLMMPKMDGIQVLSKLSADPQLNSIPILVLTNLATLNDTISQKYTQVARYLIKSEYEPKQIVEIIKETLALSPHKG